MNITKLFLMGIAILSFAIPPVSCALVNGTFYYRNTTAPNDIYEKIVMPGDTLVLGRTYDLTNVYGVSGKFAWWRYYEDEGMTCFPDLINDVDYINSGGTIFKNNITLDPEHWHTGNWWQWDGCFQKPFDKSHPDPQYQTYVNDDNLMFRIINDPNPPTVSPTTIPTTIITEKPTIKPTTITVTTPAPPPKDDNWSWWYWPIGIVGGLIVVRIFW